MDVFLFFIKVMISRCYRNILDYLQVAPLTLASLNSARDLGPRMVAWPAGWGDAAFPDHMGGYFYVYIFAR
jgi:glycerol uptake facilitator-like aquaporin